MSQEPNVKQPDSLTQVLALLQDIVELKALEDKASLTQVLAPHEPNEKQ